MSEEVIYIENSENQTDQKDNGSLAPYFLYSGEASLAEIIFGSVDSARCFVDRFEATR